MIDQKTGCITLSPTCQLKAGTTFDDVFALSLGEVQEVVDRGKGWRWLTVRNLEVDGYYLILSLGFRANALNLIELVTSQDRFDLTRDWDSWSESDERNLLNKLQDWLRNELGHEGRFEWGYAQAIYDPKCGSSSISIRYQ